MVLLFEIHCLFHIHIPQQYLVFMLSTEGYIEKGCFFFPSNKGISLIWKMLSIRCPAVALKEICQRVKMRGNCYQLSFIYSLTSVLTPNSSSLHMAIHATNPEYLILYGIHWFEAASISKTCWLDNPNIFF